MDAALKSSHTRVPLWRGEREEIVGILHAKTLLRALREAGGSDLAELDTILADVRSLATRGDHRTIVARYGTIDDTPEDETWNSTELLYEIGRAFGMLGNEEKVERYLLRCAELAPRRAAVFHCAIGWYFQRKKKCHVSGSAEPAGYSNGLLS